MFIQEDVSSTFHKERERPTKLITTNLLLFLEKMRNEGDKEGNAGERKQRRDEREKKVVFNGGYSGKTEAKGALFCSNF